MPLHAVADGLRGWVVYPVYPWPRLFTKTRACLARARLYILFLGVGRLDFSRVSR